MGNCLRKCFSRFDRRRKFLSTKYSVEKEASIEEAPCTDTTDTTAPLLDQTLFENLMAQDDVQTEMSKLVTEREKHLVSTRQYNTLIDEQQQRDADIERQLRADEEELKREEEAYLEAKREAARLAQLHRQKEEAAKATTNGPTSWSVGEDGEWEVAGGEDDFEMFLENVKARSLKATAHLRTGSHDGQSSNSSPTQQTRDRSHTEGSNSIELEWDHDEDVGLPSLPLRKPRSATEEDLMDLAKQESRESPNLSGELEWDTDTEFVAADDFDTQNLIASEFKMASSS